MQVFMSLAEEVLRRIDEGEIDPKNEMLGVKIGTLELKEAVVEGESRGWCC